VRNFIGAAMIVTGLGLPAAGPAKANLVTNGDFETGSFSGWTVSDPGLPTTPSVIVVTTINPPPDPVHTCLDAVLCPPVFAGSFSAALGSVGALGSISQVLTTVPGQTYDLSYEFISDGLTPNLFGVSFGADPVVPLAFAPANHPNDGDYSTATSADYDLFNFLVTATSTATTLLFQEQNDNGNFGLDNVSVVAATVTAAEPDGISLFLAGAGLLGFGAWRRRRTS